MTRSNDKGIALVLALFMILIMSTLATSLMFVSQTETWSSQNYRLMSQARYGAESGVHKTANHLMFNYIAPGTNPGDPLVNYNMTVSPVTWGGNPVVLSSDPTVPANYPIAAVQTAFAAATKGPLTVSNGTVNYTSVARLIAMRQITSAYTGLPVTLQTWEITSNSTIGNVTRRAETEVSAILERPTLPAFSYAAFATSDQCGALSFAGGATTDSYDSSTFGGGGAPPTDAWGGNVGTNGNLDEAGNPTMVYGSLSSPRSGVGACSAGNVTALSGNEHVASGIVPLAQPIDLPTPDAPDPLPPQVPMDFSKGSPCPAGTAFPSCDLYLDPMTLAPTGQILDASLNVATPGKMVLGDLSIGSHAEFHVKAGTYIINSLTMNANAHIVIDSGPVIFQVAGVDQATPITITGNGISNTTYKPENLQFVYGGTGEVKMAGGAETSALLYAPNAEGSFTGSSDWYGAVIVKKLKEGGGASIHYDRNLSKWAVVAGNQMMNSFTWKKF